MRAYPLVRFLIVLLLLSICPFAVWAADLIVASGETVTLPAGEHTFDSLEIAAGGTVKLTGETRIIVLGNARILGGARSGKIDGTGKRGQNGADGQFTPNPGIPGQPGGHGKDGGDGARLSLSVYGDLFLSGWIDLSGGNSGKGGQGATGSEPIASNCSSGPHITGQTGGNGGQGGHGGMGGSLKVMVTGRLTFSGGRFLAGGGFGGDAGKGGRAGGSLASSCCEDRFYVGKSCNGPGGNAGQPGDGGKGGNIQVWAGSIHGQETTNRIVASGGNGGDGAFGGRGANGAPYWYSEVNCPGCFPGTAGTREGLGSAGGRGGDGGAVWVQSACSMGRVVLEARGYAGGDATPDPFNTFPPSPPTHGGVCPSSPEFPCPVCLDGLDGRAGASGGAGGAGGSGFLNAGTATAGTLPTVDVRGGPGNKGGRGADGGSSTYPPGRNPNARIGQGGKGGQGGQGGPGGFALYAAPSLSPLPEALLVGGQGGVGGNGGDGPYLNETQRVKAPNGDQGAAGLDGVLTTSLEPAGQVRLMLSVDRDQADWGDVYTYNLGVVTPVARDRITVRIPTPAQVTALDASPGFALNDDVFSWTVENLAPCEIRVFSLKVQVRPGTPHNSLIVNQGTARAGGQDSDSNQAVVLVKVEGADRPIRPDNALGPDHSLQPGPDPVHPGTGNFFFQRRLFAYPGRGGLPVILELTYNSLDAATQGPPGFGWTHAYNIFITQQGNELRLKWGDGRVDHYIRSGGDFAPVESHTHVRLHDAEGGGWLAQTPDGLNYQFNTAGRLTSISDPGGRVLTLAHASGRLSRITDTAGRQINFSYTDGRLTRIDGPGQSVNLAHNASGDLTRLTLPGGGRYDFTYTGQHRLRTIKDPRGVTVLDQTYDAQGRVRTQKDALGGVTSYEYETDTGRTRITAPGGKVAVHYYDQAFNLQAVEDGLGNAAFFGYDALGRPVQATDKTGRRLRLGYDDRGNPTSVMDADGVSLTMYNPQGRVTAQIDPLGRTYSYVHDQHGNLVEARDPLGRASTMEYTEHGQLRTYTDRTGGAWGFAFDAQGLMQRATNPTGLAVTFGHDQAGRRTAVIWPGGEEAYTYDAAGRLSTLRDALGRVTEWTHDAAGNVTRRARPATNQETRFEYDAQGRLAKIIDALGGETGYAYDAAGNLTRVEDADGIALIHEYDAANQLVATVDAQGRRSTYAYDAAGRMVRKADPAGHVWQWTYDVVGRVETQTDPLGNVTRHDYDAGGRLITITDGEGQEVDFTVDDAGNLVRETYPDGTFTEYAYDHEGRPTSLTRAGEQWRFDYDAGGRMTALITPSGGRHERVFDALGRLIEQTDPRGEKTALAYDAASRITRMAAGQNAAYDFTWDQADNLTRVVGPDGTWTMTYDRLGRRTGLTDPRGKSLAWTYSPAGRVRTMTYPGNKTLTYDYDALGRLAAVRDWAGNTTRYDYNTSGRLVRIRWPGGVTSQYEHDGVGRQISVTHRRGNGQMILEQRADLNQVGKITDVQTEGLGAQPATELATDFTYNAAGLLTESRTGQAATTFTHDAAGNLTRTTGTGGATLTYDGFGRLTRHVQGATQTDFAYDWQGYLVSRAAGGQTSHFLREDEAVFCLYGQDGRIQSYLIHGVGLAYTLDQNGQARILLEDLLGSVVAVADQTGQASLPWTYDPWGRPVGTPPQNPSLPWLYHGKNGVYADGSGLYLMGRRFYDPQTMRFLSPDPLGPLAGAGPHRYALSDPMNFLDEDGLSAKEGRLHIWNNIKLDYTNWGPQKTEWPSSSGECELWQVSPSPNYSPNLTHRGWKPVGGSLESTQRLVRNGFGSYAGGNAAMMDYYVFNEIPYTVNAAGKVVQAVPYQKVGALRFGVMKASAYVEQVVFRNILRVTASTQITAVTVLNQGMRLVGRWVIVPLILYDTAVTSYQGGEWFAENLLFYDETTGRAMTFEEYYMEAYMALPEVRDFLNVPVDPQTYMHTKIKIREDIMEHQRWLDGLNRDVTVRRK